MAVGIYSLDKLATPGSICGHVTPPEVHESARRSSLLASTTDTCELYRRMTTVLWLSEALLISIN